MQLWAAAALLLVGGIEGRSSSSIDLSFSLRNRPSAPAAAAAALPSSSLVLLRGGGGGEDTLRVAISARVGAAITEAAAGRRQGPWGARRWLARVAAPAGRRREEDQEGVGQTKP